MPPPMRAFEDNTNKLKSSAAPEKNKPITKLGDEPEV